MMFPNQIILKHNKRLKTEEDQIKLKSIKADVFDMNIDISTTLRKYFRTITKYNEVKTNKNISFFNFRAEKINVHVQSMLNIPYGAFKNGKYWYYKRLELVCKKYYKAKNVKVYTNYSYILENINDKFFTIVEPIDNIQMTLEIKLLTYFKLPFCSTCHSLQGLSVEDEICLFDCNTPYVDRNFVWTALTRARELKNITYFHHSDYEVQRLENSRLLQYLKLKIENYKRQDLDAKRKINRDKYVDIEWFTKEINGNEVCPLCNSKYYIVLDDNNDVRCNISIDRLDNTIPHIKENCHLLCIECNKCKR